MGLVSDMKNEINKTGGSKGKVFYVKKDSKRRIRFLKDAEDGQQFTFHDSFQDGINALCQEELGKECPYCGQEGLRTRKMFAWPVWDYDAKEVKIFLYAANNCTPVPAIISMYETYGTLTDRDFVISRAGEQQNTTYTVIPMDKAKFKASKETKVPSDKEILKIVAKAFQPNAEDIDEDEDEDEEVEATKKKSKARKQEPEDEDVDEDEVDYYEMSTKELYNLCKERGIKCKPKKSEDYYIDLLETDDEAEDEDDDEWDEED